MSILHLKPKVVPKISDQFPLLESIHIQNKYDPLSEGFSRSNASES